MLVNEVKQPKPKEMRKDMVWRRIQKDIVLDIHLEQNHYHMDSLPSDVVFGL